MNSQTEQERIDLANGLIAQVGELEVKQWGTYSNANIAESMQPTAVVTAVRELANDLVMTVRKLGDEGVRELNIADLRVLTEDVRAPLVGCLSALDVYGGRLAAQGGSGPDFYRTFIGDINPLLRKLAMNTPYLRSLRQRAMQNHLESALAEVTAAAARQEALETRAKATQDEADRLVSSLKAAALGHAVAKQGRSFRDAETTFKGIGKAWLVAFCVSIGALLLVILGFIILGGPPRPLLSWTVADNLSYFAGHALLLSCLSFGSVVCLKNYRAARHNEIMNAHRARALSTFEEFRSAAEGAAGLDIVLLQAASAIFWSPTIRLC